MITFAFTMANTYAKIYLHIIFAVKNRYDLMPPHWQKIIHGYMAQALRNMGHFPIAIGGTDDHVHILIDYNPANPLPDMVKDLKVGTTKFIRQQRMTPFMFKWQRGYACFSYSHSQIQTVANYINNQTEHHKGRTLQDEIKYIFERFGIEYDENFIFTTPE